MKFYRTLHPRPVVIIGSGNVKQNKVNFMACSWITPVSDEPPTVGIACANEHYTYELIKNFGEFSINIVEDFELIFKVGSTKGRKIDKAQAFNLKVSSGKKLQIPVLNEALAILECKVIKEIEVGDHTFFIGEVKHWEAKNFDEFGYKEFWKVPLHKSGKVFCFSSKKLYFAGEK